MGTIRLLIDTPNGLITATGEIVNLSEGGCALRVYRAIEARQPGRVNVEVAGKEMWLPVVTRWVRAGSRAWTVGCEFDRATPEKKRAIRALILERRRLTA